MANSRQSATIFSPSSKRPTKRTRSSITEHSFQGITPSPKGKKCPPCVRYKVSPMSQAAKKEVNPLWETEKVVHVVQLVGPGDRTPFQPSRPIPGAPPAAAAA